jgi:hypothetical protein
MSISCDCSIDNYDSAEFVSETFPIARKEYKCCECGEAIEPGQKYQRYMGKWDGEFEAFITCMGCYRIRMQYCRRGWEFGGLAYQIGDCLGFDYRYVPEDDE